MTNQTPLDSTKLEPGITVIPYDPASNAYLLPRNHHGDPVAPLTAAAQPYRFCWTDRGQAMVYAETADDLLAHWIPEYRLADAAGRARLRAEHALKVRPGLIARLIVEADEAGTEISEDEEQLLTADLSNLPADLRRWDSPVPLVLLEGAYFPYTDRRPPLSGIDGDVQSPSNIIWLRNAHSDRYLESLAEAGLIQIDVAAG